MKRYRVQSGTTARIALTLPFAAAIWLLTMPSGMWPATFMAFIGLSIASGAVLWTAWRSGPAIWPVRQLVYATAITSAPQRPLPLSLGNPPHARSIAPDLPLASRKSPARRARTCGRWAAAVGELLLLVWSIPFIIILIGLPIVLVVRLLLEIGERLLGS